MALRSSPHLRSCGAYTWRTRASGTRICLLRSRNSCLIAALAAEMSPGPGPPQDFLTPSPQDLFARPVTSPMDFPPPGPEFAAAPVFCLPVSLVSHPGTFFRRHVHVPSGGGVLAGRKGGRRPPALKFDSRPPSPQPGIPIGNWSREATPALNPPGAWGPGL